MITNNHQELLKTFGEALGLELVFDENGNCDLIFNDDIPVTIRSNEDDGIIVLSSPLLTELPDPIDYSTVQIFLSMALMPCLSAGGNTPVVALDEESGLVVLYQICTASALNDKGLLEIFSEYIKNLITIKDNLEDKNDSSTKSNSEFVKDTLIA